MTKLVAVPLRFVALYFFSMSVGSGAMAVVLLGINASLWLPFCVAIGAAQAFILWIIWVAGQDDIRKRGYRW